MEAGTKPSAFPVPVSRDHEEESEEGWPREREGPGRELRPEAGCGSAPRG